MPRSRALQSLASVLASVVLPALDSAARSELSADIVLLFLFAVTPWAVGVALRETLGRTRVLAAKAERARLAQELEAERAAAAERKRIARELHDVFANSLSVMIVQASLAADLVAQDPDGATGAVAEVERSGRAALGGTGRLLRRIRDGSDEAGTHPQRGVADLPTLAAEYARAGLGIDLELESVERLPAGIDLSIYRIVQEADERAQARAGQPGARASCAQSVRHRSRGRQRPSALGRARDRAERPRPPRAPRARSLAASSSGRTRCSSTPRPATSGESGATSRRWSGSATGLRIPSTVPT